MSIKDDLQSNFRSEYLKARVNVYLTNVYLMDKMNQIIKPHKLSIAQFNTLRILRGQYPKTASIGLIKERMVDKNSDISRMIDRLFAKKLVDRVECKNDRRQKDIKITKKGLDILTTIDVLEINLDNSLHHLSETEITELNRLLDKMRE
ncbi:MAG: MarR family transcriptional regulator [Flavobacteriaceae bacterium]|nr:MAG: MarR family transcriptional regulator [Flavobacteriaceae bacterium]